MPPEEPVEGRLVDVQGQPAAGVVVRLASVNLQPELQSYDARGAPGPWPPPATTDANGRFRLLGLGPDAPATLEVQDPRSARQAFAIRKRSGRMSEAEVMFGPGGTVAPRPAQVLDLHVVHADDGRPSSGARVDIRSTAGRRPTYMGKLTGARTDEQGRARIVPWPGDRFPIRVFPADREPYLPTALFVEWPRAASRHSVEVKLPRGAVVRGRLTEDPAGVPVAGGWVVYAQTRRGNAQTSRLAPIEAISGPDGTFTVVAPFGPGHLLVQGPTADYLHAATSNVEMGVAPRPSFHMYPDVHAVLDLEEGEEPRPLELHLKRGVTVSGRVVGPDGRPVAAAFAFGRSYVSYGASPYPMTGFVGRPPRIEAKDGRFEIPGCDPETPSTFYFLDGKHHLGATIQLSGRSAADGPVTVRLRPTATVSLLLKRPDGKVPGDSEVRRQLTGLRLIITPGPDWEEINRKIDVIPGDFAYQFNLDFDPDHPRKPGPDGRVTLRNLIPGAPYRFRGRDFTPEAGQTVDLGEVVDEGGRR